MKLMNVNININDEPFLSISRLSLYYEKSGKKESHSPDKHNFITNLFLTVSLKYFFEILNNTINGSMDSFISENIFQITIDNLNPLIYLYVNACFEKNQIPSDQIDYKKVDEYILREKLIFEFTNSFENNLDPPLRNVILFYSGGYNEDVSFFDDLCKSFMKSKTTLEVGSVIQSRYVLENCISDSKSKIWKITDNKNPKNNLIAKFTPLKEFFDEKELSKLMKKGQDEILKELKERNLDYKNYMLIPGMKDFLSKTRFLYVDLTYDEGYSVFVQDNLGVSLDKIEIRDSKFLCKMISNLFHSLIETNYCFNNFNPEHICIDSDKVFIIDLKRLSYVNSRPKTISTSGYSSLSLCNGLAPTPYDDMESIFYVFEFIVFKNFHHYSSQEEEKNNKLNLVNINPLIAEILTRIREQKQNHSSIFNNYKGEHRSFLHEVFHYEFGFLLANYNETENNLTPDLKLSKGETILFNSLKQELDIPGKRERLNLNPINENQFIFYVIQHIKYGCLYDDETQSKINIFLNN